MSTPAREPSGPGHILLHTPVAILGGAERALLDVVTSFLRGPSHRRIDVVVGDEGPLTERLRAAGAHVSVLKLPRVLLRLGEGSGGGVRNALSVGPPAFAYIRRLRHVVKARRPAVVHTNGMKSHVLATLACAGVAPVVWHIRDFVSARPLSRAVLSTIAPMAAGAIAVSAAVARDLSAGARTPPTFVVHDAIDLTAFSPGDPDEQPHWLDQQASAPPAAPGVVRVGLVATYARWKGHRIFLEAASLVRSDQPIRFYIVGGPVYLTPGSQVSVRELTEWSRELGIERRTALVGFQSDAARVYRALDVVVHASVAPEPFGLTIAEGMACGRPVIASRTAGCLELVEPGEHVLTVNAGDPHELALAIERLVRDPELRARMGASAMRRARDAFDSRRLSRELERVYSAIGAFPPL